MKKTERNIEIFYMRKAGASLQVIADAYGVCVQRVAQILKPAEKNEQNKAYYRRRIAREKNS